MADLETKLQEASSARIPDDRDRRRIFHGRLYREAAGDMRPADKYEAMVMVADSHAVGFMGERAAACMVS